MGPPSAAAAADGDSCSVSSWSLMSGQNESVGAPATPDPQGGDESPDATDPLANGGAGHVDLGAENARLVARLAQTQQDKWRLEERVSHLEESNAAMADEMVRRGQLIQFYCMDQRPNVIRPGNIEIHFSVNFQSSGLFQAYWKLILNLQKRIVEVWLDFSVCCAGTIVLQ